MVTTIIQNDALERQVYFLIGDIADILKVVQDKETASLLNHAMNELKKCFSKEGGNCHG